MNAAPAATVRRLDAANVHRIGLAFVALVLALCIAQATRAQNMERAPTPSSTASETRFLAFDLLLDSKTASLAAWQIEIIDDSGRAQIVGVEGGEHAAFADTPYYDPRALTQRRIVLAAYSTSDSLPTGKTRVARLRIAIDGPADPTFTIRVIAAARDDGSTIEVHASLARS